MMAQRSLRSIQSAPTLHSTQLLVPSRLRSAPVRPVVAQVSSVVEPSSGSSSVLDERLRRQLETDARRREMAAQRAADRQLQDSGLKWWEVDCPDNMVNVGCPAALDNIVRGVTDKLLVVNFFAEECYACRSMQPKLRQIARDNPDALFVKVNGSGSEELRQHCEAMGIARIPYFHFYRDGVLVSHFTANMRPDRLQLLRAEIAAHKPAGEVSVAADNAGYRALEA